MRTPLRTIALALTLVPSLAAAQTADGLALDRFEPAPAGDVFFLADHPWYSSTRYMAAGLTVERGSDPLVFRDRATGATTGVVTGMFVGHVGVAGAFLDRVGVGLSLPVSFFQSGATFDAGAARLGPAGTVALGDARVTLRGRLFGHADRDVLSLHVGAHVFVPSGSASTNMGDGAVRFEPRLVLAGRGGPIRWSTVLAWQYRSARVAGTVPVDPELRLTAAVGVTLFDDTLTVGPEAYVVTPVSDASSQGRGLFGDTRWGAEAMLGARYLLADTVQLAAAGGVGIANGVGIPGSRFVFSVAWAPVTRAAPPPAGPVDSDGDGVADPDDRCPTTPQGDHPDPASRGCPAGDVDGDGVLDADDACREEPQGATADPARRGCPLRDRDSDGVFDGDDVCPEEPQGPSADPTRRGCPTADRDRDGVLDHADACPDAPRLPFPDPQREGCPLPDADHDLVPEPPDACPGQTGVPSPDPRRNGCPDARVQVTAGAIRIAEQVQFRRDRDRIDRRSFGVLEGVASVMQGAAFIRRVSVEGHTDDRAAPAHNLDLSQRRAAAVMRWLIAHGVAAERLEAHGFGQTRPIADNGTDDGRAQNRRVEFRIVDPAPPAQDAAPAAPAVATPAVAAPPPADAPAEREGRHHRGRRHHRRRH